MNGFPLKGIRTGVLAVLASLATGGQAQADLSTSSNPAKPSTRGAELRALAETLRQKDQTDQQRVDKFTQDTGIPRRHVLPDGRILELQRFSASGRPVFYLTSNVDAADTVSTDELWPGGRTGLGLTGSGMFTAIWDGGAVDPTHTDFDVRLNQVDSPGGVSGHATHVAGTLIGSGVGYPFTQGGNFLAQGMAFEAELDAYDWNLDTAEMADAALAGLRVSNHSYGIAAGWVFTQGAKPDDVNLEGDPDVSLYNWWWLGGPADTDLEDPNFGYYDSQSQEWDQVAYDAPYYLIVKAGGNDRSDIGPGAGEPYLVIGDYDEATNTYAWSESTLSRPYDCAPLGFDCLPTNSVAKNVLTVGAVDDIPGGYAPVAGPGQVAMTEFSGWGPTDDGRIKPDLVGNGVFLLSTYAPNTYAAASGTSMAAPNVTGSLLLLQQHYENLNGGASMLAATLKALAIHTADEAGEFDGPDYVFGWGLFNAEAAANFLADADGPNHHVIEGALTDGSVDTHDISITQNDARVTVTLVWTDPPGTPVSPQVIDADDPMLVNDLDLRVDDGSQVHFPWSLEPSDPTAAATRSDNFRDNVEQVEITGGAPGTYSITVRHKGTLLGGNPQPYSLLVSQESVPPTSSSLVIDEDFSGGLPAGWTVGGDGAPWSVYDPVPGSARYDNNTLGAGRFAMVDIAGSVYTNSWMQLPELDLSSATNVIVKFQSFFYFDTWELLYLELSTDGGASFEPVWQTGGFVPYPTSPVLEVSEASGQSRVTFRFRFDSFSDPVGDLWQLDNIQVEAVGLGEPDPDPDPLPPTAASAPSPSDGSTGQPLDVPLTWIPGNGTETHDVYFGTSNALSASDWQGSPVDPAFDPGPLSAGQTYYWRVDETNTGGTTVGPTWSFTTEPDSTPPPTLTGLVLADLSGTQIPGNRGRWSAEVSASVQDDTGLPVEGVTLSGTWGGDTGGTGTCVTDAAGQCAVTKQNLKSNVVSVSFTVDNLEKTDYSYEPDNNLVAATVNIGDTGGGGEDPPPPTGEGSLTLTTYKVKGIQHVDLGWGGIAGATVDIFRDGVEISDDSTPNDGAYTDNIGVKGGGTYGYAVCEAGTSNCVTGTAVF